jgi:ACS family hexuronate transporter-like MFS transporter
VLVRALTDPISYFLLFWIPLYFQNKHGFNLKQIGLFVWIPYAVAAIGSTLAVPIVSAVALLAGWRWAFAIVGATGFLWVAAWALLYRLPKDHPWITDPEKAMILAGNDAPKAETPAKVPFSRLLGMKATWGCVAARVLTDPISYFLFFWTPQYFQRERGFNLADVGIYLWIPFVALTLGNLSSGAIPRWLISRGVPLDRARKGTMLAVSLCMPVLCLMVTRVQSPAAAIAIMTAIMFGHTAWGNITLPAEVFPSRVVGTVSGIGGALGATVGAVTQLNIGKVVENVSFAPIFAFCAFAYLAGFLLVHFLIGRLGEIREV